MRNSLQDQLKNLIDDVKNEQKPGEGIESPIDLGEGPSDDIEFKIGIPDKIP